MTTKGSALNDDQMQDSDKTHQLDGRYVQSAGFELACQ